MKATVLIILLAFAAVSKAEDLYVEETGENEIIPIGNVQFLIHFMFRAIDSAKRGLFIYCYCFLFTNKNHALNYHA